MKIKTIIIVLTAMLAATAVIFQSCKKEENPPNQLPNCKITSPTNGQEITEGTTVAIDIDANDGDGNISEVRFYIDGVGKGSASSFPYNYDWNTTGEATGQHTIKATAIDNNSGEASNEITVTLIAGGTTPVATFTATPTSGTAPLIVNFTDQSSNTPTSWQWGFGDGGKSTEQNPTHTFNSAGTYTVTLTASNSYGSDTEVKTGYIYVTDGGGGTGTFTDPRDGQTYAIVEIGSQTWFAENLNYETSNSWWYGNSSANGDDYGRLYTWDAALTACPAGWHLPSDDEWKTLEMYLGMSQSEADGIGWRGTDEGGKMKDTGTIHWYSPNTGATNTSGFTALPGGSRYSNGSFLSLDGNGYWWSSTEYSDSYAWYRFLHFTQVQVYRHYNYYKTDGFSVRCLKN